MASSDEFFQAQQPAAVLKHGVLLRYAVYFAGRAGQTSGRVSYVDGYAGPGRYGDGAPGSPFLLSRAASQAELFGRDVRLVLVEESEDLAESLEEATGDDLRASVINDRFENIVEDVLQQTANTATLMFLDPFSIGLGFTQLSEILAASKPGRPIDILYHFSVQSVARLARLVTTASQDAPDWIDATAERIDNLMGEIDWRSAFANQNSDERSFQIAADIAHKFSAAVAAASGARSCTIDVRRKPGQLPIYSLCLITKDPKAVWDFADMAGKAHVDWIERCDADEHEAYLQQLAITGAMTLFDPPPTTRSDIEAAINTDGNGDFFMKRIGLAE